MLTSSESSSNGISWSTPSVLLLLLPCIIDALIGEDMDWFPLQSIGNLVTRGWSDNMLRYNLLISTGFGIFSKSYGSEYSLFT